MKYFYVLVSLWLIKCGCFLNHRVKLSTISRFSHIDNVLPESFNQFREIPDWLKVRCAELGYTTPTPVQSEAIPTIFTGKDVLVQAQTGSGKTLVYALPVLSRIVSTRSSIQAVVIVPTRELAIQVSSVLRKLCLHSRPKIQIMPILLGSKNKRQQIWAAAEPPHIVVGNPSALQKLVDMGKLKLNAVNFVVVDEVDACFSDMTIREELHRLLSRHLSNSFQLPEDSEDEEFVVGNTHYKQVKTTTPLEEYHNVRQTIMCSATIPQRNHFAQLCYQNEWTETVAEVINISKDTIVPLHVLHEYIPCEIEQRLAITGYLMKQHWQYHRQNNASNQIIIFVDEEERLVEYQQYLGNMMKKAFAQDELLFLPLSSSKDATAMLTLTSKQQQKRSAASTSAIITLLSSNMNIQDRKYALSQFHSGQSKILLCSDLASRGLDIPATGLVIQMSVPNSADLYVHRAGRTGRLYREGQVITLIQPLEEFVIQRYKNVLGCEMKKRILAEKKSKANSSPLTSTSSPSIEPT